MIQIENIIPHQVYSAASEKISLDDRKHNSNSPRAWKKGSSSSSSSGSKKQPFLAKPNRPLSSYNLFFQVERERLLKDDDESTASYRVEDVVRMSRWHKIRPRRPHRKTHGKISFHDLSREISKRWKILDDRSRQLFIDQAKVEKEEYAIQYRAWEEQQQEQQQQQQQQQQQGEPQIQGSSKINNNRSTVSKTEQSRVLSAQDFQDDSFDSGASCTDESVEISGFGSLAMLLENSEDPLGPSTLFVETCSSFDLLDETTPDSAISSSNASCASAARPLPCPSNASAIKPARTTTSTSSNSSERVFDSADELLLVLSVTNHHNNIFGASSSTSSSTSDALDKASFMDNDLTAALDSTCMEALFD